MKTGAAQHLKQQIKQCKKRYTSFSRQVRARAGWHSENQRLHGRIMPSCLAAAWRRYIPAKDRGISRRRPHKSGRNEQRKPGQIEWSGFLFCELVNLLKWNSYWLFCFCTTCSTGLIKGFQPTPAGQKKIRYGKEVSCAAGHLNWLLIKTNVMRVLVLK